MTEQQNQPADVYRATEVRDVLDKIYDEEITSVDNVPETIEELTRLVVEEGTFAPDCNVTADVSLTLRERLTGKRSQDVTAMLLIGLVLGSALERDVPMDTELENLWREGKYVLPEKVDD